MNIPAIFPVHFFFGKVMDFSKFNLKSKIASVSIFSSWSIEPLLVLMFCSTPKKATSCLQDHHSSSLFPSAPAAWIASIEELN
jgi:hypothetical protein